VKTICVIPSRYASSRLPGKSLALIAGKPMVQWVYEQAQKAHKIDRVIVATDHAKIKECVESFAGEVRMTDPDLASGTDRVYAAIEDEEADIIINLQGDEPFVSPQLLDDLVTTFDDDAIEISTPVCKIEEPAEIHNPNVVGVVRDINGFALYFSRSTIPFVRKEADLETWGLKHTFYKHIGIYTYRKSCLAELVQLKESNLELSEKLEQLRFLENGYKIFTLQTTYNSVSVDTLEDLKKVNDLAEKMILNKR
jgi:3-deoxy-manno-octulosonate cytidylyltransferase (CMP-KDO synthetase)